MLKGEALDRFVEAYWGDRLSGQALDTPAQDLALESGSIAGELSQSETVRVTASGEMFDSEESARPEHIPDDDYALPMDGMLIRPMIRGKIGKRTWVGLLIMLLTLPLILYLSVRYFHGQKYLLCSLIVVIFAMVPFFMVFEGRKPEPREMMVIAVLAAIGVAGRAAFFMIPSFKPIAAVVILTGVSLGGEAGFLVACMIVLVSNMFMGQGPWTPWQMFSYGLIGFLAGMLFQKGILKPKRSHLCVFGFLSVIFIFGGIMNPASVLMGFGYLSWESVLAYYISGLPIDLVHATSTVLFLWFMSRPLLEKLERVKTKYGLCESRR